MHEQFIMWSHLSSTPVQWRNLNKDVKIVKISMPACFTTWWFVRLAYRIVSQVERRSITSTSEKGSHIYGHCSTALLQIRRALAMALKEYIRGFRSVSSFDQHSGICRWTHNWPCHSVLGCVLHVLLILTRVHTTNKDSQPQSCMPRQLLGHKLYKLDNPAEHWARHS